MSLLDSSWSIEFHSGIPAYRQIINHIQAARADGRLRSGDQLPSIRALHQKLSLSPNTVAKAYRELELAGVIAAEQGSGCFVAPAAPAPALPAAVKQAKIKELSTRFAAEAHSHGISLQELVQQFNH